MLDRLEYEMFDFTSQIIQSNKVIPLLITLVKILILKCQQLLAFKISDQTKFHTEMFPKLFTLRFIRLT